MKHHATLIAAAALACAGCDKPMAQQEASPPPISVAPATPHPATAARQRAVQMYPALATKGSPFNLAFLEIYEQRKNANPQSLTRADWPVEVAQQTAVILTAKAREAAPPAVVAATPAPLPPMGSNALNKPAYGQTKAFVDTDGDGKKFDFNQKSRIK